MTTRLTAADVIPQVYLGRMHEGRDIVEPVIVPMENQGAIVGDGVLFRAVIPCRTSGTHGLTWRVLPHQEDLGHPHETGLIAWAHGLSLKAMIDGGVVDAAIVAVHDRREHRARGGKTLIEYSGSATLDNIRELIAPIAS